MKALFEKVHYPEGASWRFYLRQLADLPFEWHYHPEYELTLTLNSQGERFVGDHIDTYDHGDLVLLGPNLPHSWSSTQPIDPALPHQVYVLWFHQDWVNGLCQQFPEFHNLGHFLDQSRRGLRWSTKTARALAPLFAQLPDADHSQRFILLVQILMLLQAQPSDALASTNFHSQAAQADDQRQLSALLDCLHREFQHALSLSELAKRHHMSQSTLSRFFRRQMNQTLHQYLTQVRLGHAGASLIQGNKPVGLIAEQSGFTNLSNFNRLFRQHKGMTPRAFRQSYLRRQPSSSFTSQLVGHLTRSTDKS